MNLEKTVRAAVDAGTVILGTKETLNGVLTEKTKFVVVASNCEKNAKEDLKKYSEISGLDVHEFNGSSVELGEVCGKPFVVSMLAILDSKESKGKRNG